MNRVIPFLFICTIYLLTSCGNINNSDSLSNSNAAVTDSATYCYVVYNADVNSKTNDGKAFITITEYEKSDYPVEYYAGIIYPEANAVVSCHKSTFDSLTGGYRFATIDGEIVDSTAVTNLSADSISKAILAGDTLKITSRTVTPNPELDSLYAAF